MSADMKVRKSEVPPMNDVYRRAVYVEQRGSQDLTPKQWRRLLHKSRGYAAKMKRYNERAKEA